MSKKNSIEEHMSITDGFDLLPFKDCLPKDIVLEFGPSGDFGTRPAMKKPTTNDEDRVKLEKEDDINHLVQNTSELSVIEIDTIQTDTDYTFSGLNYIYTSSANSNSYLDHLPPKKKRSLEPIPQNLSRQHIEADVIVHTYCESASSTSVDDLPDRDKQVITDEPNGSAEYNAIMKDLTTLPTETQPEMESSKIKFQKKPRTVSSFSKRKHFYLLPFPQDSESEESECPNCTCKTVTLKNNTRYTLKRVISHNKVHPTDHLTKWQEMHHNQKTHDANNGGPPSLPKEEDYAEFVLIGLDEPSEELEEFYFPEFSRIYNKLPQSSEGDTFKELVKRSQQEVKVCVHKHHRDDGDCSNHSFFDFTELRRENCTEISFYSVSSNSVSSCQANSHATIENCGFKMSDLFSCFSCCFKKNYC